MSRTSQNTNNDSPGCVGGCLGFSLVVAGPFMLLTWAFGLEEGDAIFNALMVITGIWGVVVAVALLGTWGSTKEISTQTPEQVETPKRQHIPKAVKQAVWDRDGGQCVECGSKENLEFDHVIPFSKGGSSTERNLQILCQRCNRSKGSRIS